MCNICVTPVIVSLFCPGIAFASDLRSSHLFVDPPSLVCTTFSLVVFCEGLGFMYIHFPTWHGASRNFALPPEADRFRAVSLKLYSSTAKLLYSLICRRPRFPERRRELERERNQRGQQGVWSREEHEPLLLPSPPTTIGCGSPWWARHKRARNLGSRGPSGTGSDPEKKCSVHAKT